MHSKRLPTPATALRILVLLACFLVVTGFDACNDDPLLDPSNEGGGGGPTCHPSYGCSASLEPRDPSNPTRF